MTVKSWVRGRLYLAPNSTSEARPLGKPVDFSYDYGLENEDVEFAGAPVTTALGLLATPSIEINYVRDDPEDLALAAARHWRANGTGVKFYLYLDATSEATVYAYGYAAIEGTTLEGAAKGGLRGSFTLRPGPEAIWDDSNLTG